MQPPAPEVDHQAQAGGEGDGGKSGDLEVTQAAGHGAVGEPFPQPGGKGVEGRDRHLAVLKPTRIRVQDLPAVAVVSGLVGRQAQVRQAGDGQSDERGKEQADGVAFAGQGPRRASLHLGTGPHLEGAPTENRGLPISCLRPPSRLYSGPHPLQAMSIPLHEGTHGRGISSEGGVPSLTTARRSSRLQARDSPLQATPAIVRANETRLFRCSAPRWSLSNGRFLTVARTLESPWDTRIGVLA